MSVCRGQLNDAWLVARRIGILLPTPLRLTVTASPTWHPVHRWESCGQIHVSAACSKHRAVGEQAVNESTEHFVQGSNQARDKDITRHERNRTSRKELAHSSETIATVEQQMRYSLARLRCARILPTP